MLRIDIRRVGRQLGELSRRAPGAVRAAAAEGWYFHGDAMSQNRLRQLKFNYTSNIIANLIGGNFLTGLLIMMNADDGYIGLISIIAFAGNLFQLFSPLLLERFAQRKLLLIRVRCAVMFLNIVALGAIPLLPAPGPAKLVAFASVVLVANVLSAAIAPGFAVWHLQFTPWNMRARYFSFLSMSNGLVVAIAVLAGSKAADIFEAAGLELEGLVILRLATAAIVVADLLQLRKMDEFPYPSDGARPSIKSIALKPLRERKYLLTVGLACIWHFTANIPASYYSVYLLRDVGVSYSFITLVSMLNIPALIFLTPFWRKKLGKYSWFMVLGMAMGLYLLHLVGLSFVTARTIFLYPIILLYAYVLAVGINLSFTNIPYVNIPEKSQTVYIAFYSTMANLAALLGATTGRMFVTRAAGLTVRLFGVSMGDKQLLMLLVAALMLVGAGAILLLERRTRAAADAG
ncbi:MAG: MFS transporter [Clostridiales bacterium]|jgi:MFS family permease|nr:MFS transporter [Clostridiales bacterium]